MNEEQIKEIKTDYTDINSKDLIYSIWAKPKQTLKYIIEKCPEKYVMILLVLGGIVRSISRASDKGMGDNMPLVGVLFITILTGGLFGWISYYIYAWAMSETGFWLDGEAKPKEFRTIIAWALIPTIASLILLVPKIILLEDDLFRSVAQDESTFNNICWFIFGIIDLILGIWTLVILVIGIKLIQGFNTGKAILNMMLPVLIILIPVLLIIYWIS